MSVRCGRCSGRHESVADVRACYNGQQPQRTAENVSAAERATPKQVKFLDSMLSRARATLVGDVQIDQLPKRRASELIDGLMDYNKNGKPLPAGIRLLPEKLAGGPVPARVPTQATPDVPAGNYAVRSLTGSNDLDFFLVIRPDKGQWAGRTFVRRVIGGRPDVAVRGATARAALLAILADPGAAVRYGQEIGRCYRCNRHLTDEISRRLGIGPTCRTAS